MSDKMDPDKWIEYFDKLSHLFIYAFTFIFLAAENRTGACTHLVCANGEFNISGIANLMNGLKREDGISYLVASIMGPQSSGE